MNNLEKIREYWNTRSEGYRQQIEKEREEHKDESVSYTHLRAHET